MGGEERQTFQDTVLYGMLVSGSIHLHHMAFAAISRRNDVNASQSGQYIGENTFSVSAVCL